MMMTLIQRMREIVGATSMVSRSSMERRARKLPLQVQIRCKRVVPRSKENQSSMKFHKLPRKKRTTMTLIFWLSLSKVLIVKLSRITQTSYKTTRSSKRERVNNRVNKLREMRKKDLEQRNKGHAKMTRDLEMMTHGMLPLEKMLMRFQGVA